MEDGYKNWSIVRKLLIDNRLEHSALLAYAIGVSEQMFTLRARAAYRKTDLRVTDAVHAQNAFVADLEAVDKARAEAEAEAETAAPSETPSTAVTLDRVTEEPGAGAPPAAAEKDP